MAHWGSCRTQLYARGSGGSSDVRKCGHAAAPLQVAGPEELEDGEAAFQWLIRCGRACTLWLCVCTVAALLFAQCGCAGMNPHLSTCFASWAVGRRRAVAPDAQLPLRRPPRKDLVTGVGLVLGMWQG